MAFCGSCGAQVQDGDKFCPVCGQTVAAAAPPAQAVQPMQPAQASQVVQPVQPAPAAQPVQAPAGAQYAPPPAGPQYAQPQAYQPPVVPSAPGQADIRDAQENKTMAILAYILFFIPLLTGAHKSSPFVKFHTNQGTVLFLASLGLSIVFGILSAIITAIFTATYAWGALLTLSTIFGLVWMVLAIVIGVLAIVGIVNAAGGRMKPLPVIGRFTIIK